MLLGGWTGKGGVVCLKKKKSTKPTINVEIIIMVVFDNTTVSDNTKVTFVKIKHRILIGCI